MKSGRELSWLERFDCSTQPEMDHLAAFGKHWNKGGSTHNEGSPQLLISAQRLICRSIANCFSTWVDSMKDWLVPKIRIWRCGIAKGEGSSSSSPRPLEFIAT